LRFPRIVRLRRDKTPEDIDTLATARLIFKGKDQRDGANNHPDT
jgi:hypothetical protein